MNIIPLIVGSIFFAVGINTILRYLHFKQQGKKIKGRVRAIEKYISTTTTNGRKTRSVFYRPIVDYLYKEKTRIVSGMGTNEIRYKLKQSVTVLTIENEDGSVHARIEDSLSCIIGIIFSLMGLGTLAVYIFLTDGSWILACIVAPVTLGIGYAFSKILHGFTAIVESARDSQEIDDDSVLIETKEDYIKEISSHSFWGKIIAYSLMLLSLGIIYAGYAQLPAEAANLIFSDFNTFWKQLINGDLPSSWKKPLILSGIGLFFFLASLRSIYYVTKKYGGLMRI